jgi:hypothetical protein
MIMARVMNGMVDWTLFDHQVHEHRWGSTFRLYWVVTVSKIGCHEL